jgi:hypothetical protein
MRMTRCESDQTKRSEQTTIKQINRVAQCQRHHPVALDAQMSKLSRKSERLANRAFLLNEYQEQNS